MECRISSLLHLLLMISHKYIQLIKNILLAKTWSRCIFELPNIVFNPMFTCFGCARQNVALVMEWFPDFCPFVFACNSHQELYTSSTSKTVDSFQKHDFYPPGPVTIQLFEASRCDPVVANRTPGRPSVKIQFAMQSHFLSGICLIFVRYLCDIL